MYAGTRSLAKEVSRVSAADVAPGDVLVVPGSTGHAVLVLDVAREGDRAHRDAVERAAEVSIAYSPPAGSRIPKRAPLPTSLTSLISARIAAQRCLTNASPRPVPPTPRERPSSTR